MILNLLKLNMDVNSNIDVSVRVERDTFGPIEVHGNKYYGAQTMRSIINFPIGDPMGERMPLPDIQGMGVLKKAAAEVSVSILQIIVHFIPMWPSP